MVRDSQFTHTRHIRGGAHMTGVGHVGEKELARLLQARSLAAWEVLFEPHFDRVESLCPWSHVLP